MAFDHTDGHCHTHRNIHVNGYFYPYHNTHAYSDGHCYDYSHSHSNADHHADNHVYHDSFGYANEHVDTHSDVDLPASLWGLSSASPSTSRLIVAAAR